MTHNPVGFPHLLQLYIYLYETNNSDVRGLASKEIEKYAI
jgi:hypothetical protein